MTTLQTEFTEQELLATHPIAEPVFAGGVRCHGGFDENGNYVSPRTLNRGPAIDAWKAQREEQFGTPLLDTPLDAWPEHYPNVQQTKYLISQGIRQPMITDLTRIGTVEGFGGMIRHSNIPNLQALFDEEIKGTAIAHLDRGLYEAHARDEAGFEEEAGHEQMWYAARDIAFESPVTEDQTRVMLERMGIARAGAPVSEEEAKRMREAALASRLLPDDVDYDLEVLIARMARLLLIEISAFHTFAWAEEVLSDLDLVAGEGAAAKIVSYVRQDETPHVEYLKTVLSEMRDRTFVADSGRKYAGAEMVGRIWDKAVSDSLGVRRQQGLAVTLNEVDHALADHPKKADILETFHALGSIRPVADGRWEPNTEPLTSY